MLQLEPTSQSPAAAQVSGAMHVWLLLQFAVVQSEVATLEAIKKRKVDGEERLATLKGEVPNKADADLALKRAKEAGRDRVEG